MCGLIGSDLLRLCREDLIQICGTADGIRLYNALQAKYDFFSQQIKGIGLVLLQLIDYNQHDSLNNLQ